MASFDWGRILAGVGSGLSSAGQPNGNFSQGVMQGAQFYDANADRKRQQEIDAITMELRRQQIEEARDAHSRKAAQEKARNDFFASFGKSGPMAPNNGRPGGMAPQGPMDAGWNPDQLAYLQAFPEQADQIIGQKLFPVADKPKTTDDILEYDLYRQQGGEESFTDWMRGNKKAGAQSTTVTVTTPKSILAGDNKLLEIGAEGFTQAQEILPLFDIAETAAKNFSQSGPLGGAALFTERAKNYLGLPNNANAGEVLQGMQTRLGTLLRVPGSGATSNMEMSLYMQGVPGLLNSQQGNIALAQIGKKLTKKRMDNFQRLQAYVEKNGTSVGYVPDETPALTSEETQMLLGAANGGGAAQTTPKAGDVMDGYRFKGGDPGDQNNWEPVGTVY